MSPWEDPYLNEYVAVSIRLGHVLDIGRRGGAAKRFHVLDELAEQLGLDPDRMQWAGYQLLGGMISGLEAALEGPEMDWADAALSGQHVEIVAAAVDQVDLVTLLEAGAEFGWAKRLRFKNGTDYVNVEERAREAMVTALAPKVFKMLDKWRGRDAWSKDLDLGIVPIPKRTGVVRSVPYEERENA